mmetsp:Transcript_9319/g.13845  ORF Transcript_9319/g.13845 Transcript_9319/m.13845 type:complete len:212 (-) Transcript_9319:106-741(-)
MVHSACNYSRYIEWYDTPFNDPLSFELKQIIKSATRSDHLWKSLNLEFMYESFESGEANITNGVAMDLTSIQCREALAQLRINLAGKHGPLSDQSIHDEMCNEFCLSSDKLREDALSRTGCNCLQLSTQPDEIAYTKKGDWCYMNSGRILCNELERCGIWKCSLSDFHCPRREYNRKEVLLKGYGDECNSGMAPISHWAALCCLVTMFWFG